MRRALQTGPFETTDLRRIQGWIRGWFPTLAQLLPFSHKGRGEERTRYAAAFGKRYALNVSRSAVFRILPVAVCGMPSTNTMSSGIHHFAILPSMYLRMSSRVAVW